MCDRIDRVDHGKECMHNLVERARYPLARCRSPTAFRFGDDENGSVDSSGFTLKLSQCLGNWDLRRLVTRSLWLRKGPHCMGGAPACGWRGENNVKGNPYSSETRGFSIPIARASQSAPSHTRGAVTDCRVGSPKALVKRRLPLRADLLSSILAIRKDLKQNAIGKHR